MKLEFEHLDGHYMMTINDENLLSVCVPVGGQWVPIFEREVEEYLDLGDCYQVALDMIEESQ